MNAKTTEVFILKTWVHNSFPLYDIHLKVCRHHKIYQCLDVYFFQEFVIQKTSLQCVPDLTQHF